VGWLPLGSQCALLKWRLGSLGDTLGKVQMELMLHSRKRTPVTDPVLPNILDRINFTMAACCGLV